MSVRWIRTSRSCSILAVDPSDREPTPGSTAGAGSGSSGGRSGKLSPGLHLVRAPLTANAGTTVHMIRALMSEGVRGGIYLSVDRPSRYVSFLLRKQGIDIAHITFIDIVSAISAERVAEKGGVILGDSFLHSKFLTSVFLRATEGGERLSPSVDLGAMDFLYVDNLATSLCYNPDERLLELVEDLKSLRSQQPGMRIVVFVQSESRAAFIALLEAAADSTRDNPGAGAVA